jgi:hypothetical protein
MVKVKVTEPVNEITVEVDVPEYSGVIDHVLACASQEGAERIFEDDPDHQWAANGFTVVSEFEDHRAEFFVHIDWSPSFYVSRKNSA